MKASLSAEEWAEKIAGDIVGNRHSYDKHCSHSRELMQLDGAPATREQYFDLIRRTLLDPKAIGRTRGDDKSTLCLYSHETKMVVLVSPRMTGDASTAYPLADKAPLKFLDKIENMQALAQKTKSIHNGLIYNHGEGLPHNAREAFQEKFETRDMSGRFTGKDRSGIRIQPLTGEKGPFAEWLKIRAVPQKLSEYFGECCAAKASRCAPLNRHVPGFVTH